MDEKRCFGESEQALTMAVESLDPQSARELLEEGGIDIESRDVRGDSFLIKAAGNGYFESPESVELVSILLEHAAAVDARGSGGMTAALAAAMSGHETIFEVLANAGADLLARADSGESASDLAKREGYAEFAKIVAARMLAMRERVELGRVLSSPSKSVGGPRI